MSTRPRSSTPDRSGRLRAVRGALTVHPTGGCGRQFGAPVATRRHFVVVVVRIVGREPYGLDVLRYTEKIRTFGDFVSVRGRPGPRLLDVVRSDPVSFFGNHAAPRVHADGVGGVVQPAVPAVALLAAVTARWRDRLYFVLLVVVGVATAVAATPYDDPSIAGAGSSRSLPVPPSGLRSAARRRDAGSRPLASPRSTRRASTRSPTACAPPAVRRSAWPRRS